MADETEQEPDGLTPANDNNGAAKQERQQRMDRAVLTIARIIGCRIAQEQLEARRTAASSPSPIVAILADLCRAERPSSSWPGLSRPSTS